MATSTPLYNSRVIDTYIRFVKRYYAHLDIADLLESSGMKPYEVADQGHWFTQEQVDQFYTRLVQLTNNGDLAREAGRYAASADALGAMRQYVLGMFGPEKIFDLVGKSAEILTKSSNYESKVIGRNKVEIIVTPKDGVNEKAFQCDNRMGIFEAIVMMFNYNVPGISHTECMFRGGKSCRYIISWENTRSSLWLRVRNSLAIPISLALFGSLFFNPFLTFTTLLPSFASVLLGLTLASEFRGKKELQASLHTLTGSTEKLVDQININSNNTQLTQEIGQAISGKTNIESILESIIQTLEQRLDYDRGLILLANPDNSRLIFRGGYGFQNDQLLLLNKVAFHLDRPESKGIFVVSFREQKPFLINDINELTESLSLRSMALAKKLGAQSFICCPIVCDGESLGIIAVENLENKRLLVQSDMSLMMGIAPVIGVSIRNAELLAIKQQQFNSTLQVMAASIDARDPLTAGHSAKVTEYALGICGELDLSNDFREMVRVAALLHDYGKIGIPDAILKKEGTLTDSEFEIVKTHCEKTREILEAINFEGIFCRVPEVAGAHHEKYDGTGYPQGLKGKEIPLGARIIAVADFFEAITAKRHYRDPMPLDIAFKLLRQEKEKHFDPRVVEAFIKYFAKAHAKKPYPGIERRHIRIPCRTSISVKALDREIIGISADISTRGVFVAAESSIEQGTSVELDFHLPGDPSAKSRARGRIAWVNTFERPRKPSFPEGFGIEFLEEYPVLQQALENFFHTNRIPVEIANLNNLANA